MSAISSLDSTLLSKLQVLLQKIRACPLPFATITAAVLLIGVGIPAVRYIRDDYRKWLALGRGGAPYNFLGYIFAQCLGAAGHSDVISTKIHTRDAEASKLEATSFLEPAGTLSVRRGPRPHISKWAAPVRQLNEKAPEYIKQKLFTSLQDISSTSSLRARIVLRASQIEGGIQHRPNALHISQEDDAADPARRSAAYGPTELYHIHPSDGSAHCLVSAADAKVIIESGWGERHQLAGARIGGFPATYVHVYAPRDLKEITVHEKVIRAAVRYAARK